MDDAPRLTNIFWRLFYAATVPFTVGLATEGILRLTAGVSGIGPYTGIGLYTSIMSYGVGMLWLANTPVRSNAILGCVILLYTLAMPVLLLVAWLGWLDLLTRSGI